MSCVKVMTADESPHQSPVTQQESYRGWSPSVTRCTCFQQLHRCTRACHSTHARVRESLVDTQRGLLSRVGWIVPIAHDSQELTMRMCASRSSDVWQRKCCLVDSRVSSHSVNLRILVSDFKSIYLSLYICLTFLLL